ncbi:MAG: hypothetical protein Q7J57_03805 [Gemmobacter sp.]|nr:hypothetical protein [Gemmobacter sp.]
MRAAMRVQVGFLVLSLSIATWGLVKSPFTAPLIDRSAAAVAIVLEREMARTVTADWLIPRLATALADQDLARADMLAGLATEHAVVVPDAMTIARDDLRAAKSGWLVSAAACGRCALDVMQCDSTPQLASCGLPLEITPVGDLNALRRAGMAALSGNEVDNLEVGLALVGLGATALVLVTGGSSATIKAGATGLRLARRLDVLTPSFGRVLGQMADLPINWGRVAPYMVGTARLDEVTDTARLARLGAVAGDLGTVARNTSAADALVLLRHVDGPEDAARLARISTSAGPDTGRVMDVLGKGRAFRALVRLSDLALSTLAALYAMVVQAFTLLASLAGNRLARGLVAVANRGRFGP